MSDATIGGLVNQEEGCDHMTVAIVASVKVPALAAREKAWISKRYWLRNALSLWSKSDPTSLQVLVAPFLTPYNANTRGQRRKNLFYCG